MILLAITPGEGFQASRWAAVLESGIDALLLREPGMDPSALREAAAWCLERRPEVRIWVRDLVVPGCGLHLPEGATLAAPPDTPLSRPLHDESQWGERREAAQLLVAPILETPGKGPAWGRERLHRFLEALPEGGPRMLALGGITPEVTPILCHPRLAGLAAIRPFWSGDPAGTVRAFRQGWS